VNQGKESRFQWSRSYWWHRQEDV